MKKSSVFLWVTAIGCTTLLTSASAYAEGVNRPARMMLYPDKVSNYVFSYKEDNLTDVTTKIIGIWQFAQIDHGAIRYSFFRNAKSGYIQIWKVSNTGISRLYGGKLFPTQR